MSNFIGTYDCKADVKGRVMIPKALKSQLDPMIHKGFIIKRSAFQSCLELYPKDEWNVLMEKMGKLNRFNKKTDLFIRKFSAGLKEVDVDAAGRLQIPKNLIEKVGIHKEVVLSSAINIIEIWDKNSYEEVINDPSIDFGDLAEEVMGGNDGIDLS